MISAQSYFKKLIKSLNEELAAEEEQDRQNRLVYSKRKRIERGEIWSDVRIVDARTGLGGNHILKVERMTNRGIPHKYYLGNTVSLYTTDYQTGKATSHRLDAQIKALFDDDYDGMLLTVESNNGKELPDWLFYESIGMEKCFRPSHYKKMKENLVKVSKTTDKKLSKIRDLLIGKENVAAEFDDHSIGPVPDHLNERQWKAVARIFNCKDLMIVHGPPGTGKTTTLVEAIVQKFKKGEAKQQILVTAPSNAAVDLLTERIADRGISVLRLGNPLKIKGKAVEYTLESHLEKHPNSSLKKEIEKEFNKFRDLARKLRLANRRRKDRGYLARAKQLTDYNQNNRKDYRDLEKFMSKQILNNVQVITTTLMGSSYQQIRSRDFSAVFIDEAAQAIELSCWMPITKAKSVIMFGDHKQLPPVVKTKVEGEDSKLHSTLFEKAIGNFDHSIMLNIQYRMHEQIMKLPSTNFYSNKLIAASEVASHRLINSSKTANEAALWFYDTSQLSDKLESRFEGSSSYRNEMEAKLLLEHLGELIQSHAKGGKVNFSIGIVSPYKGQVMWLAELIKKAKQKWKIKVDLIVDSIDSFQGRERDVIYISLVRSNAKGEYGFLKESRRMNVAISRARKKLFIFGDSKTILRAERQSAKDTPTKLAPLLFNKMVDHAKLIGGYYAYSE